jgi:hypothetical protein
MPPRRRSPFYRAAAIIEARRRVFGIVQGNGKRSGRKVRAAPTACRVVCQHRLLCELLSADWRLFPVPVSHTACVSLSTTLSPFPIFAQILRANLYGPTIRGYYPLTNGDLQLAKVGIYNPQQEEVYRCVL